VGNGAYIPKDEISEGEKFIPNKTITYKVVGVASRHYSENYDAAGYSVFTLEETLDKDDLINIYITFDKVRNVYDKTDKLARKLGLELEMPSSDEYRINPDIQYNDILLSLYGENKYDNFNSGILMLIIIMLSIISIGCIAVIYNSFAISVMERKKQFGLFSSIGATKKQLQKTVFYEAFIIGLIGLPLGLISGFIGIGVVLEIINYLLPNIFVNKLLLSFYPLFIIVPLIFMIIVIVISAFIPSRSASKISPIEAIRLNDDIKIKNKKIKSPKFINILFGIEGEVAYKNIKRNKKKYRITIISLFVSIVMFISFSSFVQYGEVGTSDFLNLIDYDVSTTIYTGKDMIYEEIFNQVKKQEGLTEILGLEGLHMITPKIPYKNYHKDYQKILDLYEKNDIIYYDEDTDYRNIVVYKVDDESYLKYKKTFNLKEDQPILINQFEITTYFKNTKLKNKGKLFKDIKSLEIDLCWRNYDFESDSESFDCLTKLTNIVGIDTVPFGLNLSVANETPTIIMPEHLYNSLKTELTKGEDDYHGKEKEIRIKTESPDEMTKLLEEFESHPDIEFMNITNIVERTRTERNLMIVVKLLLYGFISLVTLIGVTSVFNTINTSIELRRKEFAVLRSIGLTPKGFNKMLRFETIIIGLKSLFYAIPASLGVVYWIHRSTGDIVNFSSVMIPWKAIIIAMFGVFAIVTITMAYSTKKIKHENILDSIREENI
ncbi:MAG: FtsX-like permease family protein, partial [Bacilli bacterium]|nr:FtsX-like permease family protein [Bacilli bacterium]